MNAATGTGAFSVSETGLLVYHTSNVDVRGPRPTSDDQTQPKVRSTAFCQPAYAASR